LVATALLAALMTLGGASGEQANPPAAPADATVDAPAAGKWSPPRFTARQRERDEMVETIRGYGLDDSSVLKAMAAVPRHEFVPDAHSSVAYADTPLPIGHGQTISQPYIVAEMTRLLRLKPESRVLEIGAGSGYQAAVLTEFTRHVWTIEIIKPLAESAQKRLKRLGYDVVEVKRADGYHGWPDKAPFDAIIVTCAAGQVPPPLIRQLAKGGRIVIPVGGPLATQSLILLEKDEQGRVTSRSLMHVRFVPLVREGDGGE
jgi:protein-L-isoaspartate(D-aspartate) O-methyltransferase